MAWFNDEENPRIDYAGSWAAVTFFCSMFFISGALFGASMAIFWLAH